ncbi:hypothetical protein AHAS_Ahas07G0160500 [Arachis hypogaea]
MTLTDFLKSGPPRFNGNANALEADQWFREVEKFLYTQHVPEVVSGDSDSYVGGRCSELVARVMSYLAGGVNGCPLE